MYVPTEEEIRNFLEVARKSSERDYLMFRLMRDMGLSTSETINLETQDINLQDQYVFVKGLENKARKLRIPEKLLRLLEKYVQEKRGNSSFLFESRMGGRMTPRQVQKIMKKYAERAEIKNDITPMALRHAFAAEFLKKRGDILKLKKWLGHKSFTSLAIYLDALGDSLGEATEIIE